MIFLTLAGLGSFFLYYTFFSYFHSRQVCCSGRLLRLDGSNTGRRMGLVVPLIFHGWTSSYPQTLSGYEISFRRILERFDEIGTRKEEAEK